MSKTISRCAAVACIFFLLVSCTAEARKERHWKKGERFFEEAKYKEAIIEYRNVLQADPKNALAHYKLGMSYLNSGSIREAFAELHRAVLLDGELLNARIHLGKLFLLSGKTDKAKENADYVLAREPRNPAALLLRSRVLEEGGQLDEARHVVEESLSIDGKNPPAHIHLAKIHLRLKDSAAAERALAAGIEANPGSLVSRTALAEFYRRSNDARRAEG
ncbi:MAG: tetratricopeptide repeat protein, partial [Syntrophales bacterium]|nr:tetratricopeptide repeat protein [Syntrophales bacterium]